MSITRKREKYEWFVLRTHAQEEFRAQRELTKQDFEVFLPVARHVDHIGERKIARITPLFTRYLFIKMRWSSRNPVSYTKGVKGFVGCYQDGQKAPVLRTRIVKELKSRQVEIHGRMVFNFEPVQITEGSLVKILWGSFENTTTRVIAVEGDEVSVMINLFGKQFPKTFPKERLTLAA